MLRYAIKWGVFSGYRVANTATKVAKHSVHNRELVTSLRCGCRAWQQLPSLWSNLHDSRRSSHMSTNSRFKIFLTRWHR